MQGLLSPDIEEKVVANVEIRETFKISKIGNISSGAQKSQIIDEKGNKINPRLKELDNVFLLPHMSSATIEGRIEMGEKVIVNIKTFVDGHTPPDLVLTS